MLVLCSITSWDGRVLHRECSTTKKLSAFSTTKSTEIVECEDKCSSVIRWAIYWGRGCIRVKVKNGIFSEPPYVNNAINGIGSENYVKTWLMPRCSQWNIDHRPLISTQLCLLLPPPCLKNVDSRIQVVQLEKDEDGSKRQSWMETSGLWTTFHWEWQSISQVKCQINRSCYLVTLVSVLWAGEAWQSYSLNQTYYRESVIFSHVSKYSIYNGN